MQAAESELSCWKYDRKKEGLYCKTNHQSCRNAADRTAENICKSCIFRSLSKAFKGLTEFNSNAWVTNKTLKSILNTGKIMDGNFSIRDI